MKAIWSTNAKLTFIEILQNIEQRFSLKEAESFYNETFHIISLIERNPYLFELNEKHHVRRALIQHISSLFYEVDDHNKTIQLLTFHHNRMSEDHIKSLL
ncbi:hypothetical protein UJ101_01433 [Flavobacteriaceae bacterium UJ101]|nr:hypothetical protein UJ101_01433 [Flavobacteriaceae bacterium UJ101]